MTVQDKNKLIAWFDLKIKTDQLEYHNSWNRLMPVVEKIHNQLSLPENKDYLDAFMNLTIFSSIDQVHQCCFEFIQFYNANNKT